MEKINLLVGVLFVYAALILTMQYNTVFSWDGAEFSWNVEHMMFGHPPGAPIYHFLGYLLSMFFSGDTALKLLSYLAGLGIMVYSYSIAERLKAGTGIIAIALMMTAPLFIANLTMVEIYMLSGFFLIAAIERFPDRWVMSAILFAAGIAVYPPVVFFSPYFIISAFCCKPLCWWPDVRKLCQKSKEILLRAVLTIVLAAVFSFYFYLPLMHDIGFDRIVAIGGRVWDNPSLITLTERIVITFGLFGLGSLCALQWFKRREREMIPLIASIIPFGMFLFGGSVHFMEHLFLPVPIVAIIGSYYLKDSKLLIPVLIAALALGLFTMVVLDNLYSQMERQINGTLDMITTNVPKGSIVIDLLNYEHLNYYLKDYRVYALGTPEEIGTSRELHNKGLLTVSWYWNTTTIANVSQSNRVYILNTAFYDGRSLPNYNLSEVASMTFQHDGVWKFIVQPREFVSNITLYELKPLSI